ncbi:MAG: LacI family DNA-binding transcriptional regulator [Victivallales bacterium]|nr:LacI family DNA-binding transcriptional regulator [Victivallales bacterium]
MISLKNIADLCGVSESTVSKALKNHPQIKKLTRERIQEIAKKHNYHPNAMVECMQTGRSRTIGIAYNKFDDMFAGGIMQGVHEELYRQGYETIVICWDMIVKKEAELFNKFSRRRVDGMLIFPMEKLPSSYYMEQLRNFHNPIVIIDQTWEGNEYDFVGSDNFRGAYMAAEHMIKRGISELGAICCTSVSSGQERERGFRKALAEYNIAVNEDWMLDIGDCIDAPFHKIYDFLERTDRPGGLFCFNDNCAVDAVAAAKDLGITVPDELSLVGFGDLSIASRIRPALTTIGQNPAEIGRLAAKLLIKRIKSKDEIKMAMENYVVDVKLIERNTVREKTKE